MLFNTLLLASSPILARAFVYTVGVGIDERTGLEGVGFDPSSTQTQLYDIINFEFRAGTHEVYESTFDNPCTPSGSFHAGPETVPAGGTGSTFTFNVTDSDPHWFFDATTCTQGGVFSVNPPVTGDETAGAFLAAALALGGNTALPPQSSAVGSSSASVISSAAAQPTTSASASVSASTSASASASATTTGSSSSAAGRSINAFAFVAPIVVIAKLVL